MNRKKMIIALLLVTILILLSYGLVTRQEREHTTTKATFSQTENDLAPKTTEPRPDEQETSPIATPTIVSPAPDPESETETELTFSVISEMLPGLIGTWEESSEENTEQEVIYRRAGSWAAPPARYRHAFTITETGACTERKPSPDDGHYMSSAECSLERNGEVDRLILGDLAYDVIALETDRLIFADPTEVTAATRPDEYEKIDGIYGYISIGEAVQLYYSDGSPAEYLSDPYNTTGASREFYEQYATAMGVGAPTFAIIGIEPSRLEIRLEAEIPESRWVLRAEADKPYINFSFWPTVLLEYFSVWPSDIATNPFRSAPSPSAPPLPAPNFTTSDAVASPIQVDDNWVLVEVYLDFFASEQPDYQAWFIWREEEALLASYHAYP